jgi:hypothetical protein
MIVSFLCLFAIASLLSCAQVNTAISGSGLVATLHWVYPPALLSSTFPARPLQTYTYYFSDNERMVVHTPATQASDATLTFASDSGSILSFPYDAYDAAMDVIALDANGEYLDFKVCSVLN